LIDLLWWRLDKGRVDEHLAGTIKGDIQAVENIKKFLGVKVYAPGGGMVKDLV
jgi:hypothetical protein